MDWWKVNNIPFDKRNFCRIIDALVFNCPACTCNQKKDGKYPNGKTKYSYEYKPVSAREVSFRKRGIEKGLLITLLSQSRKLVTNKMFFVIEKTESVEARVDDIFRTFLLSDPNFEIVVFKKKDGCSDAELFFYYMRNAFAHGSFEIIQSKEGKVYLLECKNNSSLNARMRLKEKTLMDYVQLSEISAAELQRMQKKRRKF